jgi:hypothetical protein
VTRPCCWTSGAPLETPTCFRCQVMLQSLRWVEVHERIDVTESDLDLAVMQQGWN